MRWSHWSRPTTTRNEPAWVLAVGDLPVDERSDDEQENLAVVRGMMSEAWHDGTVMFDLPPQHTPWQPHVCLAYSTDPTMLDELVARVGPVIFDRVRVAFAGTNHDIPLGGTRRPESTGDRPMSRALALWTEAYNPDQLRAPKGSPIGGRWVSMGAGMRSAAAKLGDRPGDIDNPFDTPENRAINELQRAGAFARTAGPHPAAPRTRGRRRPQAEIDAEVRAKIAASPWAGSEDSGPSGGRVSGTGGESLDGKSVAELRRIAADEGIPVGRRATKVQLAETISRFRHNNRAGGGSDALRSADQPEGPRRPIVPRSATRGRPDDAAPSPTGQAPPAVRGAGVFSEDPEIRARTMAQVDELDAAMSRARQPVSATVRADRPASFRASHPDAHVDALRGMTSRDDARDYVSRVKGKELEELRKHLNAPRGTASQVRANIVERLVGYRLDAEAIRSTDLRSPLSPRQTP